MKGGAAKISYKLSQEFEKKGHEVLLYTNTLDVEDARTKVSSRSTMSKTISRYLDFLPGYILSGFNKSIPYTMGVFGESLKKVIDEFKPDVISVHWTWKGFVSFNEILKVSVSVPVFWTLHDESVYMSGESYGFDTFKKAHAFKSPLVKLLSNFIGWYRKKNLTEKNNITFISPSHYIHDRFKEKEFSRIHNVSIIYNGIDKEIYVAKDKPSIKEKYGLKRDKRYLLFGAVYLNDPIKGGKFLREAIENLRDFLVEKDIGILTYGKASFDIEIDETVEIKNFGFIKEEGVISDIINLADLVLVPSIVESFGLVVTESLACQVPVVAFNVGAVPEQIIHMRTGYLAKPYDVSDLETGIKSMLNGKAVQPILSPEKFNIKLTADKYLKLFEKILENDSAK